MIRKALLGAVVFGALITGALITGALITGATTASAAPQGTQAPVTTEHAPRVGT